MGKKKVEPDVVSDDVSESESSDGESEVESVKVSKEFEENIIKYVRIDDIIRKKQAEISELKKQKKTHEDFMVEYLKKINQTEIGITNGKLKLDEQERKESLKNDTIKVALLDKIKDPIEIDKIMEMIEEARPIVKKTSIKRLMDREKKQKK